MAWKGWSSAARRAILSKRSEAKLGHRCKGGQDQQGRRGVRSVVGRAWRGAVRYSEAYLVKRGEAWHG